MSVSRHSTPSCTPPDMPGCVIQVARDCNVDGMRIFLSEEFVKWDDTLRAKVKKKAPAQELVSSRRFVCCVCFVVFVFVLKFALVCLSYSMLLGRRGFWFCRPWFSTPWECCN